MHGGGNFGDLWRTNTHKRNEFIEWFPKNLVVIMPQSIIYQNKSRAYADNKVYVGKNLIITVR